MLSELILIAAIVILWFAAGALAAVGTRRYMNQDHSEDDILFGFFLSGPIGLSVYLYLLAVSRKLSPGGFRRGVLRMVGRVSED